MVHIFSADLSDRIRTFGANGALKFVSAEWWQESPRFVLLHYSYNGFVSDKGLRLDLDKRKIIDDMDDDLVSADIRHSSTEIWRAVVAARAEVMREFV